MEILEHYFGNEILISPQQEGCWHFALLSGQTMLKGVSGSCPGSGDSFTHVFKRQLDFFLFLIIINQSGI